MIAVGGRQVDGPRCRPSTSRTASRTPAAVARASSRRQHRRRAVDGHDVVAVERHRHRDAPAARAELDHRPVGVLAGRAVEVDVLRHLRAPHVVDVGDRLVRHRDPRRDGSRAPPLVGCGRAAPDLRRSCPATTTARRSARRWPRSREDEAVEIVVIDDGSRDPRTIAVLDELAAAGACGSCARPTPASPRRCGPAPPPPRRPTSSSSTATTSPSPAPWRRSPMRSTPTPARTSPSAGSTSSATSTSWSASRRGTPGSCCTPTAGRSPRCTGGRPWTRWAASPTAPRYEDWDLLLGLAAQDRRGVLVPRVVLHYRQHGGGRRNRGAQRDLRRALRRAARAPRRALRPRARAAPRATRCPAAPGWPTARSCGRACCCRPGSCRACWPSSCGCARGSAR